MDIDPSSVSHADGGGDLWPFDSLTTSLFFSSVSSSPPLHPLPVASSSWLTPPSPLWLFDDRQMMPIEVGLRRRGAGQHCRRRRRRRGGGLPPSPLREFGHAN
ncbi:hypothetical protein ZWY2020_033464 [Hordeum vulgare]|nr:hypothetical protein ZWY2020_033464 [Hordeum vulgare]